MEKCYNNTVFDDWYRTMKKTSVDTWRIILPTNYAGDKVFQRQGGKVRLLGFKSLIHTSFKTWKTYFCSLMLSCSPPTWPDLFQAIPWTHLLRLSPSRSLLWLYWPPHGSLITQGSLLPQAPAPATSLLEWPSLCCLHGILLTSSKFLLKSTYWPIRIK